MIKQIKLLLTKMAGRCLVWCLCWVIVAVCAHVDISLDATGPFINRETASAFMTPHRSGLGVGECWGGANRWTLGGANTWTLRGDNNLEYCKSQNTRQFYPDTSDSAYSDDNDVNTVSGGWKYTNKNKGRPTRRKGLKPTGVLWHKQTRSAPPPPPACSSSPCVYGSCSNIGSSYTCSCYGGYTGGNCQTDINECASNPCANGVCSNHVNRYSCSCYGGWTGTNCHIDIDECASQPCQNGGTCHNLQNRYTCTCQEDFIGTNCETDACDTSQQTGADLVFVVDLSASQNQSLFYRQKDYIKSFISNFTIGPGHYQVAMVTYAFSPTIHFYLNTYSSVSDLHSAIDGVNFTGGASYLGSALKAVREDVLTTANGMRSGLSRYVLVLSDGLSSNLSDTQWQAEQLKWTGATLFAVAFGDQIDHTELINVASDSGKVFPSSMQDPVFSILKNHLPQCPDCFRNTSDVGILFDSSTSLKPSQYYPAIDALITLLEALPIGPTNVHVSYTKFAQHVYPEFDFSQYQNKDDVVTQVVTRRSQYIGPANLTRALDHMTNTGFTGSRGTRSAARKIAVVFTQGYFDDFNSVQTSAEALKNSGVTLALVGIGTESSTNLTSLLGLASDPAFAFVIGESVNISDDVLESLGSSVEFNICEFD